MKEDRQAFKNRMRSLRTYREQNPGKGYWEWKRAIQDYKGIDIDNDPTYDYYGFYKENPEKAKGILNDSKDAHFTDTYKTSVHPTFSNESKYSGYVNKYNPKGVIGGYWGEDNSYNFSDSQIKNNWDIHNTLRYLEDAENYGVTAKYRGMYPKDTDDIIYGGVLPQVEVRAQAFDKGGETLPTRGTTVTNAYGDKTHYIATSMDDDGTLNLSLPDIEITPRNNLNLAGSVSKAMDNVARSGVNMATYVTPLGDVEDAYNIAKDVNTGNYGQAALGIGLMALPNFIEKPIKKLVKSVKNTAAGVVTDLFTRGNITESGKNRLLNKNMLNEVDYFRPHKSRARASTVEDVFNITIHGIPRTANLEDLSLDQIYQLSDRNIKLANRSTLSPFDFEDSRIVHMDATGPQPINQEGFIPKIEGYAKVDFEKGEIPEIWWSKHTAYYPEEMYRTGRTVVTTKDKLKDAGIVIDKDDKRILTTQGTIPFEIIDFALEPNIFGWYDRVKYTNGRKLKYNEDTTKKISFQSGGEVEPPYPQFVNGQRVNRWTGQPIATGQATPVFDLRDAADFTPAGDVLAVKDTYEAVQNNDWVGAGLAAVGVLPFVPSVTKKLRREIPTVNKNYVSDAIDALDRQRYNRSSAEAAMNNETYEIVQRLMDDPSYMRRANEVKYRYGDDYLSTYADLINAYNYSPELLPKAKITKFEDARRAQMIATPESANRHRQGGEFPTLGEYEYQFDPDNAVEGMTLHELDHQVDFLKNKVPDADGNSNMFYRMRQSLKPYSDGISKYYSNPTEQKAYMNQLREFMYKRGMIKTRDEQVTKEMLQEAMNKLPKSMSSIINASKQFKSMRAYTKWFNQIPLLTAGALGINRHYNQQQEQ